MFCLSCQHLHSTSVILTVFICLELMSSWQSLVQCVCAVIIHKHPCLCACLHAWIYLRTVFLSVCVFLVSTCVISGWGVYVSLALLLTFNLGVADDGWRLCGRMQKSKSRAFLFLSCLTSPMLKTLFFLRFIFSVAVCFYLLVYQPCPILCVPFHLNVVILASHTSLVSFALPCYLLPTKFFSFPPIKL